MAIKLNLIGTYLTGIFDEGAAEIPAYDPRTQRLFVVNADAAVVDVLDLSDPSNPTPANFTIDTASITPANGVVAGVNSVAVKNGVVAVAVEVVDTTDDSIQLPGQVAFYATDGTFINAVEVGSLPDMVTFTPDGTKVLVANEGEPSSDYRSDPEGSVSIIDVSSGVENFTNAEVTTAGFADFNDQKEALTAAGVRIFGPDVSTEDPNDTVTVAQDLEPEYIAVTPDSETAYVSLQENNALAKVDISTAQVTDILPLGFKDYSASPSLETFFFEEEELPVLGDTEARGEILLGGFSGLYFEGVDSQSGNLQFITHLDRGPDAGTDAAGNRIFLLPELQPQLVRFELEPQGDLEITERVFLTREDGTPLTGLPNLPEEDPDTPVDEEGNSLEFDPLGADLEGIVRADDGSYWLADEYRPSIYHFSEDGILIERYVPEGLPEQVGIPAFPAVYSQRRPNRGFEAIAYQNGKVYAFIQTPINNPESGETATARILEFDPITETTIGEYLYIQDDMGGGSDKIGDAVALNEDGEFLVIERDSNTGEDSIKNIYRIDLSEATNVNDLPEGTLEEGETLESLSPEALAERGIQPVSKELYADLAELGYTFTDKPEGLALVDPTTVAVINDNDFGESGIPIGLGLVSLNNALDPSNEDGAINIRNAPVLGMYQPDAIATYEAGDGKTYIVTANEGDAREYIVEDEAGNETAIFVEEARIGELDLDLEAFAAELQQEENLGRLLVTTTRGDTDGDGEFEELYAFGGRSFSIWDTQGNLIFDSGSELERITAEQIPNFFNSDNDENSFDTRSDDKGPEPEGVVVGTVSGRNYAFVGLERVGGIMVYDITEPTRVDFVQYINTQDFEGDPEAGTAGNIGPEGLEFIAAEDSPTGTPLLAVAYEISGSTGIFEITTPIYAIQGAGHFSPFTDNPYDEVEETNEQVVTTGIVTAIDSNGFYLQDPQGDGDIATADGIFVFTRDEPTVSVGDELRVEGTVTEFVPGGLDTNNLPITQITSPEITQLSTGNELPAPVVIGEERIPPTQVIDDDGLASYDPVADGIDFYESLEGMRVTVSEALSVSPTNRFGEIFTVANNGENATSLSDRGTINIDPDDFNPERIQIQIDSGILPNFEAPQVDADAQLGDVTGVVGYNFGNFEVNVTEPFEPVVASELEPEVTNLVGTADQLTIAAYNVLNLDPNDEDRDEDIAEGQFEQIAAQIVSNLQAPDIIALQEIQDNDGSVDSDVTAADETLALLVEQIAQISDVNYELIDNPFIGDDTSGGQPGGNIRTAYLYNPERVDFVESSLATVVDPQNQQTDPTNPFFDSRLPLVATFTFNGEEITLVNNHFSSKGGSASLFGQIQPSVELQEDPDVNGSLDERRVQANAVAEYVEAILAADPDANVAVLGDLNEFEFISPLEILEGEDGLLTNLTKTLPADERYSFIFEGNSQSLDHILVSENLVGEVVAEGVADTKVLKVESAEFDAVHVNAEFADQASDHDPLVARLNLGSEATMEDNFTFQLIHTADQEGGLPAIEDAINFSAVVNALADDFENTLKLSSGDIYIPGPFFAASNEIYDDGNDDTSEAGIGDILINNALGFQAIAFGNHEFDQGTETIERLIEADPAVTGPGIGEGGYPGTSFPYLSTNLDFSTDENLADLVVEGGQPPEPNSISNSVVIDVGGESIGVVGATTPTLPAIANPGDVGVMPDDPDDFDALAAIIQEEVDALTETGINKVILLSHFQQFAIEEQVAQLLEDVDIVMAGGSNTILANEDDRLRADDTPEEVAGPYPNELESATGEPLVLINTDGNYRYVGRLAVEFDDNGIITKILEESGAYATDEVGVDAVYGEDVNAEDVADPTVVEVTNAIAELTLERDGNVFGLTEVFLEGTRGEVRTQETNLGNLTADANLFYADFYDDAVAVSIKNGGGIRDSIGTAIVPPGGTSDELQELPPQANPAANKEEGEISQLDIENSLRFNNELTLLTVTAEELEQIVEYAVSATEEGATPGQFPQIGGFAFSFDPTMQAITIDEMGNVTTEGERVQSLAITNETGITDIIVEDGELVGDPNREIRLVTLNFLADGGDGYPFPAFGENRVDLAAQPLPEAAPNAADFTEPGTEQDALAEYLEANFPADDDDSTPVFDNPDTSPDEDERIQILTEREDTVLEGTSQPPAQPTQPQPSIPEFGSPSSDRFFTEDDDLIFGGASNDDFYVAGNNGTLFGNEGIDRFFTIGGGGNTFVGGEGADQFWIAAGELPEIANVIPDFELDTDVIGVGAVDVSSVDDLGLAQDGSDAVVSIAGTEVARFLGTETAAIESSFLFA